MANSNFFKVIGAAALIATVYKVGEIKGTLCTGIKMAKEPERCEKAKKIIDKAEADLNTIKEAHEAKKDISVKIEVVEPAEEAEEAVEETDEPDEE